jgi:phage N-6-adenine-methyltransferase
LTTKHPPLFVSWAEGLPCVYTEPFDGAIEYRPKRGTFNKSTSNSAVRTPVELIRALTRRYGKLAVDLAATAGDQIEGCDLYITPQVNSLEQDWAAIADQAYAKAIASDESGAHLYLNCPYNDIAPWIKKCAETGPRLNPCQLLIAVVPAATGAKYWKEHVDGKAFEQELGRIMFDGYAAGAMKDHMALLYSQDGDMYDAERYLDWRGLLTPEELAAYRARGKKTK